MSRHARNAGYTLMELLAATASGGVVLVGLSSTLLVASRTLDIEEGSAISRARNARAVNQLLDDVSEALAFTERTAAAITFTVPDRSGDDRPEEIRYSWSGEEGAPLTYSYNGVAIDLIHDVRALQFDYLTRTLVAPEISTGESNAGVVFEGFVDAAQSSSATSLAIGTPPGVRQGDLLVAAVAIDDEQWSVTDPSGWTRLLFGTDGDDKVALGVWWKLADESESSSHTVGWNQSARAYGWIMRFSGHDPSSPVHATASAGGRSNSPDCPAVTTSVDNCMILRLGGFDDDDVTNGDAGVAGHTTICAGESNNGSSSTSGAAAYATLETAGGSGVAEFSLNGNEQYRTLTIAIAPDPNS